MIDEDKTFNLYGYTSKELSKYSHKKIIVVCEECGKYREISNSTYTKAKYPHLCKTCALQSTERKKNLIISHTTDEYKDKYCGINHYEYKELNDKDICDKYIIDKMSMNEIATLYDISVMTVSNRLDKNNVQRRSNSEATLIINNQKNYNGENHFNYIDLIDKTKDICERYINGVSANEIADIYNVSNGKILTILNENNIAIRSNREATQLKYDDMDNPGEQMIKHHYIYDFNDLDKYTIEVTRSEHATIHHNIRRAGLEVPCINIMKDVI